MTRPPPSRVDKIAERRVLDAYFKVDEITVSFETFNGTMSEPVPLLVFDRRNEARDVQGDAAAALLFDPEHRNLILVNQFRLPTVGRSTDKGPTTGWLLEAAAGMIKLSSTTASGGSRRQETPQECIMREVLQETGYQVTDLIKIARFYASPGCSRELIHLFYAEVRGTDKIGPGGGLKQEGEHIDVVPVPEREFFTRLTDGEFEDPKLIIAGQWLKERRARTPVDTSGKPSSTYEYRLKSAPGKIIGVKTGDILQARDVDVWVNSENNFMMMDRFYGNSVSAAIRRTGALRDMTGKIEDDTIGRALAAELGRRSRVDIGQVIATTAGALSKSPYNVRQIFHVATADGESDTSGTLGTPKERLGDCVTNVLAAVEASRPAMPYRSILIPLLGTGNRGKPVREVAPELIRRAIKFFGDGRRSVRLNKIYFLAYSYGDESTLQEIIKNEFKEELESTDIPESTDGHPAWGVLGRLARGLMRRA